MASVMGFDRFKNVVWRTLTAFLPTLARADDGRAERNLEKAEYDLFLRMDVRDRAHAVAVARRLAVCYPDASNELRRAALLHDVGKIGRSYNPWTRIFVALYTPRTIVASPRLKGLRGGWQIKRHHDRYGAELIRSAGGSVRVAEIVARHHHPESDLEALHLKEVDENF